MANLITTTRLGLMFILVAFAYVLPPAWQLINVPLLTIVFVLDAIDGYVARKRGEESLFGSVFDIAVDRITENVLWIVVVNLGLVPVWVVIVFVTRGFFVDAIRNQGYSEGRQAFGLLHSRIGNWLVSGRFMRGFYAAIKGITFGWLFFVLPMPELVPKIWAEWSWLADIFTAVLVYTSVALCLARGLPVIAEFVLSELSPARENNTSRTQSGDTGTG